MQLFLPQIEKALTLADFDAAPAQEEMMFLSRLRQRPSNRPGQARQGAVLIMLYEADGQWRLPLIKRRDDLTHHPGQVAFPGGRVEYGETPYQAALRETWEEIGVPGERVALLGALSSIYIPPSDFEVHPFVGWRAGGRPAFHPDPYEVAEVIEVSLPYLLDPACRASERWELRGQGVEIPYFNIPPHKVWGATAIILSEFLARLEQITKLA
jgi:8-oxo-dGTP pyrophosphatase MutT (NUDIX family)